MEQEQIFSGRASAANALEVTPRREHSAGSRVDRLALAGELVMAVAHDLRQPLTTIEMNVSAAIQFLRRPEVAVDAALAALDAALEEDHRMRDAVQFLQDLAMRREPRREPCDVTTAVREALSLVRTDAIVRGVTIDIDVPPALPLVFGDIALMRQALVSLFVGAVEQSSIAPFDERRIRVTAGRVGDGVEVETCYPGGRGEDAASAWQLAAARAALEAHDGALIVDRASNGAMCITTRWPARA
jgi:C4-dicarboxylate-specific signal transduction histidine kinase